MSTLNKWLFGCVVVSSLIYLAQHARLVENALTRGAVEEPNAPWMRGFPPVRIRAEAEDASSPPFIGQTRGESIVSPVTTPIYPCCKPLHERCHWTWVAPYTIPECEKENLLAMLQWIKSVLHGVGWWITAGTLLGSVRNESHIPHETDIDVSVEIADWPKAVSQINAQIANTHFHFNSTTNPARLHFSKHNDVHLDFWKAQRHNGTVLDSMPVHRSGVLRPFWIDERLFFPLSKCVYNSVQYPCPRFPRFYVERRYGVDWKIPKAKQSPNPLYHDGDGYIGFGIPHSCPSPTDGGAKWQTFTDVIRVMEGLECPYNLHAGTLLDFVRHCELGDYSIDIAIPLVWWRAHEKALDDALRKADFGQVDSSGTAERPGYGAAWERRGARVRLLSRVDEARRYVWSPWKDDGSRNCSGFRESVSDALWGDLLVRVPHPYNATLAGMYGEDWRSPEKTGRRHEDAFRIGSCTN